jgi:hypothetical protein
MSESKINDTTRLDEKRWFGFKLNQTSKVILFYLALIGIIQNSNFLGWISNIVVYIDIYGFPSVMLSAQIFGVITQIIAFVISCYTLSILYKSKNNDRESVNYEIDDTGIKWFWFTLSQTSIIILLFLAIIEILTLAYSLLFQFVNLGNILRYMILYGPPDLMDILNLVTWLIIFNMVVSRIVINTYTIVRASQSRKNMDI